MNEQTPPANNKNIIICCDGTGNDFGPNLSNVVKLFSVIEKNTNQQVAYYDPGVGTPSTYDAFLPTTRMLMYVFGMAFGYGISENVMDAYAFLMRHYRSGDRVYIYGFSRGAYTARALAGLIHKCGLLNPDNHNLIPEAMRIFKLQDDSSKDTGEKFREAFGQPAFRIEFLGLWDTVTSVGWVWDPERFPYTTTNPSVKCVRHAISIDEKRAFFRQNLFSKSKTISDQDIKQVWFPGVHSDVGGGYPPERSGLSNIAFEWMLRESQLKGLQINMIDKARDIIASIPENHIAPQNEELKGGWWIAEVFPKIVNLRPENLYWPFSWLYRGKKFGKQPRFNLASRRYIGENPVLHESVLRRLKEKADYRPSNLVNKDGSVKTTYQIEPWERF